MMRLLVYIMAFVVSIPCCNARDSFGCEITQSEVRGAGDYWWHVNVWVKNSEGKVIEKRVYSVRHGLERTKALSDCDKWMKTKYKVGKDKNASVKIKQ